MKFIFYIALCIVLPFYGLAQQLQLSTKINLTLSHSSINDAIKQIANKTGVSFSFTNDIFTEYQTVTYKKDDATLETILNDIFLSNHVEWLVYQNSIILRKEKMVKSEYHLKGKVVEAKNNKGIPFVSLALIKQNQGVLCNENGFFEMSVLENQINDSVEISSVGFVRQRLAIKELLQSTQTIISLQEKVETIDPVVVCARDYKTETLGNDAFFPMGNLYLDTHGQQTALFIENAKERSGEINNVSFYISKKGNAQAPFRIHIYKLDSLIHKPGGDLLNESFVVKPNVENGWCTVDVSKFHIRIPANGFFVAIEGVYPSVFIDQKDTAISFTNEGESDDFYETPSIVSYGQKIGYSKSRKGKSNTWHYSLSHTWFQLRKNNFAVMITADIRYFKKRKAGKTND
jgi:hypothetical protein